MITRDLAPKLTEAARTWPSITLTEPRQSGKTTLCRTMFPDHPHVTLERGPGLPGHSPVPVSTKCRVPTFLYRRVMMPRCLEWCSRSQNFSVDQSVLA